MNWSILIFAAASGLCDKMARTRDRKHIAAIDHLSQDWLILRPVSSLQSSS
jgi:hypothetical protein